MFNKEKIVSALISKKQSIFNCKVRTNKRVFQLGGLGTSSLKVRFTLPDYPNLEVQAFLNWDKWDDFSPEEQELVKAFYSQLK